MIKQFAISTGAVSLLAAIGTVQPASALCLSSSVENNCSTFSGSSLSQVIQTYTSDNLGTNTRFQMGFRSSDGAAYAINNLAYSTNGTTFTPFADTFSTTGTFQFGGIQNPFSGAALGKPFYVSYDIQAPVPAGVKIESMFIANNTGSATGGVLDFNGGNFQAIERNHEAVPAPLPILGAAAVFTRFRRLKQVSKQLH